MGLYNIGMIGILQIKVCMMYTLLYKSFIMMLSTFSSAFVTQLREPPQEPKSEDI